MRGNRFQGVGSIPACAGKPRLKRLAGLPRVRPASLAYLAAGSIPACAGKPRIWLQAGLSPRVRGNPLSRRQGGRSIPACAGKPEIACRSISVCGDQRHRCIVSGLSPRVRGNQGTDKRRVYPRVCGDPSGDKDAVYPRVCGETVLPPCRRVYQLGETTLVCARSIPACAGKPRGRLGHIANGAGSIPACAGKPASTSSPHAFAPVPWTIASPKTVYPRVCGETPCKAYSVYPRNLGECLSGLSPRVRGNLEHGESETLLGLKGLSPRVRGNL